ncbi:ribosomal large subunit pseudouridine synthase C [Vibrio cholerae]|nr:ribosomal large subunit pseudouridine synthase C [Vibrio cholerae]
MYTLSTWGIQSRGMIVMVIAALMLIQRNLGLSACFCMRQTSNLCILPARKSWKSMRHSKRIWSKL